MLNFLNSTLNLSISPYIYCDTSCILPLITEKPEDETTFHLPANTPEIVSSPTAHKSKKYKKKKKRKMLENAEPAKKTDKEVVSGSIENIDGELLMTKETPTK